MNKEFISKLAGELSESVPVHLNKLKMDVEKNCQHILAKTFAKLELVTRQEFDIQSKVLLRTRQKLESLERTVKELETLLKNNGSLSP